MGEAAAVMTMVVAGSGLGLLISGGIVLAVLLKGRRVVLGSVVALALAMILMGMTAVGAASWNTHCRAYEMGLVSCGGLCTGKSEMIRAGGETGREPAPTMRATAQDGVIHG